MEIDGLRKAYNQRDDVAFEKLVAEIVELSVQHDKVRDENWKLFDSLTFALGEVQELVDTIGSFSCRFCKSNFTRSLKDKIRHKADCPYRRAKELLKKKIKE
jgi:hypothetical protein